MSWKNGKSTPSMDLRLTVPGERRVAGEGENNNYRRSSSSSSGSSCVSSDSDGQRDSPEAVSMLLVGCPRCMMYVMLPEEDPKCPKCKSTVLLDFNDSSSSKKTGKAKNKAKNN